MADDSQKLEMKPEDLYREEIYTDLKLGTIRKLIPVRPDGSDDDSREVRFTGQAQVMTPAGALPISFELEAKTIGEAAAAFGEAAEKALEETARELAELRRQAASDIVLPNAGDVSKITGGGGMPGGGLIQP